MSAEIGDLGEGQARASDSVVMILTCPECATGYFVDDAQIGSAGRKVRCASCGHRWTATVEPASASAPAEPVLATAPSGPSDSMLSRDDLPRAFRSRAEEERRLRRAAALGAVWAGAAVAAASVLGVGLVFRENVVRAWPQTASAYSLIGLPVNPVGLVIEEVRAEPSLQQGHAVLAVSGVIRNVVGRDVAAPPLRVTLLNAQGKRVAGQIDAISNARIPPGETRRFATAIFDPPFSAHDLQVDFAVGLPSRALAASARAMAPPNAPQAPAPTSLRGPASAPAAAPVSATPAPPAVVNAAIADRG